MAQLARLALDWVLRLILSLFVLNIKLDKLQCSLLYFKWYTVDKIYKPQDSPSLGSFRFNALMRMKRFGNTMETNASASTQCLPLKIWTLLSFLIWEWEHPHLITSLKILRIWVQWLQSLRFSPNSGRIMYTVGEKLPI